VAARLGGYQPLSSLQRAVGDAVAQPFVDAYDALAGRMSEQEQKDFALEAAITSYSPGLGRPLTSGLIDGLKTPFRILRGARQVGSRGATPIGKGPLMFEPPPRPSRAISDDYRYGVPADSTGRLTQTIDGDDLVARYVAGWTHADQPQKGLSQDEVLDVMTTLLGKPPERVHPNDLPGAAGVTRYDPLTNQPTRVQIRKGLDPANLRQVERHEASHVIEQAANVISAEQHLDELKALYNTLNNPKRDGLEAANTGFTPWFRHYPRGEVPREYIAEAIRRLPDRSELYQDGGPERG
jgi:hypothetical protein